MKKEKATEKTMSEKSKRIAAVTATETARIEQIETDKGIIVTIPGVRVEKLSCLVIGTAPLIVHNFSQKMRDKYRSKQTGEAQEGREPKDCIANFEGAKYKLSDGTDGVPAGGWKACIVAGFDKSSGVPQTKAKGAIRVEADDVARNLVRVIHPVEPPEVAKLPHIINETGRIPRCREDIVRNESGVIDIRHRPEYWPWACLLRIQFLPTRASAKQVLQSLAVAGFVVGQCEWRPGSKQSLSGSYGTFRLATPKEIELFSKGELFRDHEWPLDQALREAAE